MTRSARWAPITLPLLLVACGSQRNFVDLSKPEWQLRFQVQRAAKHPASLHFLNNWSLNARVIVVDKKEKQRLGMKWNYSRESLADPSNQQIRIYDRLGRTVLVVESEAGRAHLSQSRLEHRLDEAPDMATLIEANTGLRIPAEDLSRWLRAIDMDLPAGPGAAYARRYGLWQVEYLAFGDFSGWLMPERMTVKSEDLLLDITVTDWKLREFSSRQSPAEPDEDDGESIWPDIRGQQEGQPPAGAGMTRSGARLPVSALRRPESLPGQAQAGQGGAIDSIWPDIPGWQERHPPTAAPVKGLLPASGPAGSAARQPPQWPDSPPLGLFQQSL